MYIIIAKSYGEKCNDRSSIAAKECKLGMGYLVSDARSDCVNGFCGCNPNAGYTYKNGTCQLKGINYLFKLR